MDIQNIVAWMDYVYMISLVVFISVGLFHFKKLKPLHKLLILMFASSLILELVSNYIMYFAENQESLFMVPVSNLIILIILSVLYLRYILRNGKYKILLTIFAIVGIVPVGWDFFLTIQGEYEKVLFLSMIWVYLLILAFTIIYFLQIALYSDMKPETDKLVVSIVFFLISLLSVLYGLSFNFMVNESLEIVSYFWISRMMAGYIGYIVIFIVVWQYGRIYKRSKTSH